MERTAAALLAALLLPLAGCADAEPPPPSLHAFRALYSPLDPSGSGFALELEAATPQADRDLQERLAYTLTFSGGATDSPEFRMSLDGGFRLVRESRCAEEACASRSLSWPDDQEPAPWGVGWPLAPPPDANRSREGDALVLTHGWLRYEYAPGQLAPSRISPADPGDGEHGYRLLTYDVTGALGPADDWPAPAELLPNATQEWLVHPGEDQDFLGVGWTTRDAMAHLSADPEAGAILSGGGCVLHYAVLDHGVEPLLALPVPALPSGDASVHVWLQDRDGRSTSWWFAHQSDLLGPSFSEPEGDGLWPFLGDVSCEERRAAPAARMTAAEAWDLANGLVQSPAERGYVFALYRQPPDHGHGGFSPGNDGFEARVAFFPADRDGRASEVAWDLWRGSLLELALVEGDGPPPR